MRWAFLLLLASAVRAEAADPPPAEDAQPAAKRIGRVIRVEGALTDVKRQRVIQQALATIKEAKDKDANAWPVIVFEIRPGQCDFGNATELARFLAGDALGGATTVAYIPETVTGHAVLIAIACDDIMMAPDAKLGMATPLGEAIPAGTRAEYTDIARRRRTVPPAVAVAMLDPNVELLRVETNNDRRFLLDEELAEFQAKEPGVVPEVIKPKGEPGLFSGAQGRAQGFVTSLAKKDTEVLQQLGLPASALRQALPDVVRPLRATISGPISPRLVEQNQKIIQERIQGQNVNFVVIWLDSEGGSLADASSFANYLAAFDPDAVRTVAYIPTNASGEATLVALACDDIVMHQEAQLGGFGVSGAPQPDDRDAIAQLLDSIAERKKRSAALGNAMFDPSLRVYAYTHDGLTEYFTEKEMERRADRNDWRKGAEVTNHGQPLRLTGARALELNLATNVVDGFAGLKNLYGLEADPLLVEPGWADVFIDALNSAVVSWAILVIGIWALYFELHSPGLGVGGFLAGLCFLLFFWSHHLNGTAGWLEVLLFVAGVACLALEIFVMPGFGVFGLGCGALILISLVLASQTFVLPTTPEQMQETKRSLVIVVGAGFGFIVAAIALQRFLPHTPLFSKLMLNPPTDEELGELESREALADWQHLLGAEGVTTTRLAPAGKAQFGDAHLDVTAPGQYVSAGKRVVITEVRGAHITVQEAPEAS